MNLDQEEKDIKKISDLDLANQLTRFSKNTYRELLMAEAVARLLVKKNDE